MSYLGGPVVASRGRDYSDGAIVIDCLWRLAVLAGPLGLVPAAPSRRLWLWLGLWLSMLGRSDQGPKFTSSPHFKFPLPELLLFFCPQSSPQAPSLRLRILASADSSIAVLLRFGAAVLLPVPVPTPASSLFSPQGLPATPPAAQPDPLHIAGAPTDCELFAPATTVSISTSLGKSKSHHQINFQSLQTSSVLPTPTRRSDFWSDTPPPTNTLSVITRAPPTQPLASLFPPVRISMWHSRIHKE